MNKEEFYEGLREEDKEHVKFTVEKLKERNFDVYAGGSSLKRKDYKDIDLIIKPKSPVNERNMRCNLESVIKSIILEQSKKENESNQILFSKNLFGTEEIKPSYLGSSILEREKFIFTKGPQKILEPMSYLGSRIEYRENVKIEGTKIDLSISYNPFDLDPDKERVEL